MSYREHIYLERKEGELLFTNSPTLNLVKFRRFITTLSLPFLTNRRKYFAMLKTLVVCVIAVLVRVEGYGKGAPQNQCQWMMPNHYGTNPSKQPFPFTVSLSSRGYSTGETITVTIQGQGRHKFRGFLIKAVSRETEQAVGTMTPSEGTKTLACGSRGREGLTHSSNNPKPSLQFKWTAPSVSTGTIDFRVTIVESFGNYWANKEVATITPIVAVPSRVFHTPPAFVTEPVPTTAPPYSTTQAAAVTTRSATSTTTATKTLQSGPMSLQDYFFRVALSGLNPRARVVWHPNGISSPQLRLLMSLRNWINARI